MITNKNLFIELMKECERQGLSEIRKYRYALVFRKTTELGINLERLTQESIDRFFFYIKSCGKADSTKITEWKVFKKIARKAGIEKKVYPHLFRHSRATQLARYLTEMEMKIFFGWSKNSNMPSVYVHLSGRDIDEKIIQLAKAIS